MNTLAGALAITAGLGTGFLFAHIVGGPARAASAARTARSTDPATLHPATFGCLRTAVRTVAALALSLVSTRTH